MACEALQYAEVRARLPAAYGGDGHLLAVPGVATDGRVDDTLIERDHALDQRQVAFDDLVPLLLLQQRQPGTCMLRHDHQARCVFIQPVDDSRAQWRSRRFRIAGLQVRQISQERIDQRIVMMPWRGMHHQAGGFVHHQEIGIFIDDIERQGEWASVLQGSRTGDGRNLDCVPSTQQISRLALLAIDQHRSTGDQLLDGITRHVLHGLNQESIKPLAGSLGVNNEALC